MNLPVCEVVVALVIDRFDGWPRHFHDIVNKPQEFARTERRSAHTS